MKFNSHTGKLAGKKSKRKALSHEWIEKINELDVNGISKIDNLFNILYNEALNKNFKAIEYLINRVYGKPDQANLIDFSDYDSFPYNLEIEFVDEIPVLTENNGEKNG